MPTTVINPEIQMTESDEDLLADPLKYLQKYFRGDRKKDPIKISSKNYIMRRYEEELRRGKQMRKNLDHQASI